jgi:hypothetical protein
VPAHPWNLKEIAMKPIVNCAAFCAVAATLLLAPSAYAGCASPSGQSWFSRFQPAARMPQGPSDDHPGFGQRDARDASIVGFWNVTLSLDTGELFDQGFEQWHSDGTELLVDNAFPPALGNVCVGVYKQSGPRTYKLRHMTWNWDLAGTNTGWFVLLMTITMDSGNRFSGTFLTDSYDLSGAVIPSLHAEGTVRGSRITVD